MVKFLVVGFGNIGKRHASLIVEHPDAELMGVVDIDVERRKEALDLYPLKVFDNIDAFFDSKEPADVINICTPNHLHIPYSLKSLQANYHTVCEKPFGLTSSSCTKAILAAQQTDKELFCVMQNRYSPPSQWLKGLMKEDTLGKIYQVQINCFWNRDDRYYVEGGWRGTLEKDGGVLFTQFSHFVDTLYWLFGDIKNIKADFHNFKHRHNTEFEDTGSVQFDFVKGGTGAFNYSTCTYEQNLESSLTIIAEKGTVKVSGQYMQDVVWCEVEDYEFEGLPPGNPPNQYPSGAQGSASNHQYVIQNVVDTLKGKTFPDVSVEDGAKVVDMIERIYRHRPQFI